MAHSFNTITHDTEEDGSLNWRAPWVYIGSVRTVHATLWDPVLKKTKQNKGKQNETNKTSAKK